MTDQLLADIEGARLVTLTGLSGAGKSRLAAQLVGHIRECGEIDVKVVDLGKVAPVGLFEQLKDHSSLLVLDNFEDLIDEVAALAQELLFSSPNLRILATCRDRLGITGEVVRRVAPPEPNHEAELPSTASTPANGRHRNTDQAMAASEALLTEAERTLLRLLATFAGGFSLEAARQVCSGGAIERRQVLRLLGRLVDTSLVEVDNIAGCSRYRLAPIVAAHAEARLVEAGEEERIRSAHAVYFVSLLEAVPRAGQHRVGHTASVAELQAEQDNLRGALALGDFAATGRPRHPIGSRPAGALAGRRHLPTGRPVAG